jgi:translation initiation factor IF-3
VNRYKKDNNNSKRKNILASNYQVNEKIKERSMIVIDKDGHNLGELSKQAALDIAEQAELDLVIVGKKDSTAIAKVIDFGKFLYAKKKQLSLAKKKQKVVQIKEVKMRPNIGEQDYKTKMRRAFEFLKSGKKVKFTLQFRGRQFIMINELGKRFFTKIHEDLIEKHLGTLVKEKEQRSGPFWSIIYSLK